MLPVLALAMASCAAETKRVTLRIVDDQDAPVPNARVRAIAIGTSDLPLPVTMENIQQALTKTEAFATSDRTGEVRLTLLAERAHHVQVLPPCTDLHELHASAASSRVWHWYLDLDPPVVSEPIDARNDGKIRVLVIAPLTEGG